MDAALYAKILSDKSITDLKKIRIQVSGRRHEGTHSAAEIQRL